MGKTAKWLKSLLTGKKDKSRNISNNQNSSVVPENPTTTVSIPLPPTTPKEKRRWSFRRSSASATPVRELNSVEQVVTPSPPPPPAPPVVTDVIRVSGSADDEKVDAGEEAAAKMIQAVFRSYLARKALKALKGIVKLQALVRGHLVRRQASVTLKCMQALVTAQARARAQRIRMVEDSRPASRRQSPHRRSTTPDQRLRHGYHEIDSGLEENIKIVEIDHGDSKASLQSRNSYSMEHRFSNHQASPVTSSYLADQISPGACSGHFEDHFFTVAQSSPHYAESETFEYSFCPNYMANTESSRAKARSQSAPKSRPDSIERQPSGRRRSSTEGRNHVPKAMKMKRSSSHVGAAEKNSQYQYQYQYPWSIKLDRSSVSLIDSECGSTSTVLTNTNYCRSHFGYDVRV
ncbi:hypothetical protein ERO13_A09G218500v2 [Gossypium hirsutum]|uniref:Protein IQ-DOMAIN 1 n=2 Tax=Gossypium TaxID=3633 RepID=A0A1U8LPN6_GOSHI|nr:protein IQ-DOMAIN 1 [Gossypium hirsutum]KAG4185272.1 hypothetical protein ERO13_A09G218500v2 [Gossypium hirsutum]TYJ20103.1 hypothetical protein E1A91_A09G237900v1 [Gossypium mustelinum]